MILFAILFTPLLDLGRNHQGLRNRLIRGQPPAAVDAGITQLRQRLGGMLSYYYHAAA